MSSQPAAAPQPAPLLLRQEEIEWRNRNWQQLASFCGEWVVLERDRIVCHGGNLLNVLAEARRDGIATPYAFFVEPEPPHQHSSIGL